MRDNYNGAAMELFGQAVVGRAYGLGKLRELQGRREMVEVGPIYLGCIPRRGRSSEKFRCNRCTL